MTDRELLELAAKAIGKRLVPHEQAPMLDEEGAPHWNPLADDGDALRLAVKLGIDITRAQVVFWDKESTDPNAATRRAIVRAAAEIAQEVQE